LKSISFGVQGNTLGGTTINNNVQPINNNNNVENDNFNALLAVVNQITDAINGLPAVCNRGIV